MVCSRSFLPSCLTLGTLLVFASLASPATASGPAGQSAAAPRASGASSSALPLVFEQNAGQFSAGTAFAGRAPGYSVEVRPTELRFALPGKHGSQTIDMEFAHAQPGKAAGISEAPFRTNYYMGANRKNWLTGVRNYDRVALRGLYEGVDAEFYSRGNEIEHDFLVAAGADAAKIAMHVSGATDVTLSSAGDLSLHAGEGYLRLHKPAAYQVLADGSHRSVEVRFDVRKSNDSADVAFALGAYDHTRALVIDPVITYATYVGGGSGANPVAVASDTAGNVYLTGSTSSLQTSFGAATTSSSPALLVPSPQNPTMFVAKVAAGSGGSQIAWLTYYGSTTAGVSASAITLLSSASTVYVGGSTKAADLAGTTGGSVASAPGQAGNTYGYVASFATGGGTLSKATYVDGAGTGVGVTMVSALTSDAAYVTLAGLTTGASLNPTATALPVPNAVIMNAQLSKGILVRLDPTLATISYASYVAGDISANGADTYLTGIATDSSENLYFSGYTYGDFPQAGLYATSAKNTAPTGKTGHDSFAAELVSAPYPAAVIGPPAVQAGPNTPTAVLAYSYWTGGGADDLALGLTRDASGNVFVFGSTASTNLVTAASTTQTVPSTTATSTPLNANYPASANQTVGFVSKLDPNGALLVTTYIGGTTTAAATAAVNAGVTDASGNVYLTGQTSGQKATFPQQTSAATTANISGTPTLPASEDLSQDVGTTASPNAFLLEMPTTLSSVTYKAFFGSPASTSATGVGVAVDAATAPNAYVLVSDQSTGGASSFTTASAAQQKTQVTDGSVASAILAQVAYGAPAASASIVAGANSYTPTTGISYTNATTYTTANFVWQVTGAASGATSVVFNLPYNQYLQPYTSVPTVTIDNTPVTGVCTLGTASSANLNPGITCVLPTLASGSTAKFMFSDGASAAVATNPAANFTVSATAYDAQGDQVTLDQTVTIDKSVALTLAYSVAPATVNAALSATDTTTPNTTVTYTYVITNNSGNDSPSTSLSTGLSSLSKTFTIKTKTSSTGCDPTVTTCDVPSNSSLTYTVTGVYLAAQFGASATSPYTSNFTTTPSVTFTGGNSPASGPAPSAATAVTIQGNASISVALTTGATTYNSGFKLGDTGVQLILTATNSGTNSAGNVSVPVTLPQGFVETAVTISSGTGSAACGSATTCTASFTNIAGSGGTASMTITGYFKDTGTATDAVAPPTVSATPSPSTVAASPTTGMVTEQVAASSVVTTGSYAPTNTASSSKSILVTRVNNLTYTLGTTTPLAASTVNETNTPHTADSVTYTATITNTGTSVVRGLYFTVPVPVSSTMTISSVTPSYSVTPTSPNSLTCNTYTAGDSTITCYENDLKTAATGAGTTTPAALTYTLNIVATFSEATVPLTTTSGKTTVTQAATGTFEAAAATYTAPSISGTNSTTTITVQRSTVVTQTYKVQPNVNAPAAYADRTDINLDEHITGNAPGVNDGLTITATTYNSGVNDAAGVTASIPLPAYLLIVPALPATCTIGGAAVPAGYTTGATGATLVCTPPSTTTPAGTAAGQLTAQGAPCSAQSAACLYVSFAAKFVDVPSTATIVGSSAKVTVTPGSAVATGNDVDPGTGLTSAVPAAFGVQRAAHIVEVGIPTPVVNAPATYADKTDINLDEHIAGNTGGVNDKVTVSATAYNSGVNYALGVSLTIPLPAYFELFSLPANCTITGSSAVPTAAAPYTTGATGGSLTCAPPATTLPAGALAYGGSCTGATVSSSQCLVDSNTLPAKFLDAPNSSSVVGNNSTASVTIPAVGVAGTFSDSNTAQAPSGPITFGVQRAAHLFEVGGIKPNVNAPATYADKTDINLDEHTGVSAGVNDQVLLSSATYNSGVNYALNVVVRIPLPAYFEVFTIPASCVITSTPTATATPGNPFVTGSGGDSLTCTQPATTLPAGVLSYNGSCAAATTSSQCLYAGNNLLNKFLDAPSAATVVGNNATATVSLTAVTAAGTFSDSNTTQSPYPAITFGVQRAAHLTEAFALTPKVAPAASIPTYADKNDINLDEHTAGNAGGVNDQVSFSSTTYNSGVNYALNVSVKVALPAYLELFSLPANCVITGAATTVPTATSPYNTGASGAGLTCTPPAIGSTPAGALAYGGSCPAVVTSTTPCLNAVSSTPLKFVDATTSATIVGNNPTGPVTPQAPALTGTFSDSNTTQTPTAPAAFTVQRAAHVHLASSAAIATTYSDNSALSLDGTTPEIGQAAPGVNATTRVLTNTLVYNCLRYTVNVVNDGPNYANTPLLNFNLDAGGTTSFAYEQKALSSASVPLAAINCATTASGGSVITGSATPQTFSIGTVTYGGGTQSVVLDGFYNQATLNTRNNGFSTFSVTNLTQTDYNDSNTQATSGGDYKSSKVVEVVNTPINSVASGAYKLVPYTAGGASTPLSLIFNSVTAPGATGVAVTSSATGITLPSGKSPNPADSGAVRALYQPGIHPAYYSVPSTAVAPTASANPTTVCLTQPTGLADVFVKPERTLLWELLNGSAGTTYKTVPNITSTGVLAGDITISVTPVTGAYAKVAPIAFPQVPQSQPSELCGQVNGFTASASAPATFAALEPINFAPVVVAGAATASTNPGKGAGASQADLYLQVSATQTHDYNDNDPCYIAGIRTSCDDNPYLEVFLFSGPTYTGPTLVSGLSADPSPNAPANAKLLLSSNQTAGSQYYVAVADQTIGADSYNPNTAAGLYQHQGDFLLNPAVVSFPQYAVCNPGIAASNYTFASTNACPSVSGSSTQRVVTGGSGYNSSTAAAQAVTVGASTGGFIALPVPSNAPVNVGTTPPVNPVSGPAIGVVTPGQSVAYIWTWLNGAVQQSTTVRYQLACTFVKSLTDATPISAPQGAGCSISTSDPNAPSATSFAFTSANYAPTIYVTTSGTLFAERAPGVMRSIANGTIFALLLPVLLFRKRLRRSALAVVALLTLTTAPFLIGCGSAGSNAASTATPAGTYYLQVTATNATATPPSVVSAVFEVVVQNPN